MKLVAGLGNPDKEYRNNRHNVGFLCLDDFAERHHIQVKHREAHSRVGRGEVFGQEIVLAKPQTYMNLSGEAVAALKKKYRIETADILIVHDDLDLPLGRIRIRERGASAGHRGIESIMASLGTREFPRIRVGIGHPGEEAGHDVVGYVLGDFSPEERAILQRAIAAVAEAIECFVREGTGAAMNKFNSLDLRSPPAASAPLIRGPSSSPSGFREGARPSGNAFLEGAQRPKRTPGRGAAPASDGAGCPPSPASDRPETEPPRNRPQHDQP